MLSTLSREDLAKGLQKLVISIANKTKDGATFGVNDLLGSSEVSSFSHAPELE